MEDSSVKSISENDVVDEEAMVKQLLAHVPNNLVYFDYKKDMPATKEFLGVVLFADISGFTKLTECYSTMETTSGTTGTDKLSATLNAYIGKIVEEIIQRNGDVLKFAGDAILATWKCSDIGHDVKTLLNRVINCSIDIQKNCDNFETEVGIVLRVKLAIAVGPMCLTYVGLPQAKQFDLSGSAVDDVGVTEKQATPGAIILSQLAWANCDQSLFSAEGLEEGRFYRLIGHSQFGPNATENKNNKSTHNTAAGLLQTIQKTVTSPLDSLIDQLSDYKQDMPKALLLDEDEKITAGRYLTQTVITGNQVGEKNKKKFDRKTMTSNLEPSEIENLRAYVQEPVLYKLDHGQDLEWLSEMRQVSVLFINMKLPDPTIQASEALQKAFEVVHESCTKYEGNLNKVFGFDKGCTFVVIFGLPGQKHEDDPVRALKCAADIFDCLHSIPEIRNESIGVTTGFAFTGVVGHKDRHEYTVIGSRVNMAARLMMYYPGILTCDAETYEASSTRLRKQDFIAMPYIELKGLKDPGIVREYNLNSSNKDDEAVFDFPILGRKKELGQIESLLAQSTLRNDVIVIEGEAGIGKTRLLEQIMDDAESHGKRVIQVDGDLANAQLSGHISNSIISMLMGQDGEKDRILTLVKHDNEIMENIHLLSDIVSIKVSSVNATEAGEGEQYSQRRRTLFKVFQKITEQQGCVLVIDNARYVDERSWIFLRDLIGTNPSAMFIFGIRTINSVSKLSSPALEVLKSDKARPMRLSGLEKEEVIDLVCQLLQVTEAPLKLCELIQEKSQGVPLWCEQLVKDVLFSNTIQIVSRSATLPIGKQNLSKFEIPIINVSDHPTTEEMNSRKASITSDKQHELRKSAIVSKDVSLEDRNFVYDDKEYVRATEGVVSDEIDEICILTPGSDLNSVLVPVSVKDMVLARMDRMSLNEQTVLKCAAVLGQSFIRDLLKAIIPKNCSNMLDTILFNLCKQQFFECGSLNLESSQQRNQSSHLIVQEKSSLHHHHHHHHGVQGIHNAQVLCACYASEGFPLINLSQSSNFKDKKKRVCLYFHFSNTFVQEAAYALWLEDQRKAIHEKAALYLERFSDKCRACGGNGFIPGHGRGVSVNEQLKSGSGKRFSISLSSQMARSSRALSNLIPDSQNDVDAVSSVHEEAARIFKNTKSEHIKNHKIEGSRGESLGLMLIEMARGHAQKKEVFNEKQQKYFRKFGNARVHPSTAIGTLTTRTLLMEFRRSSITSQPSNSNQNKTVSADSCDIDLSQCQCAELHATTLPQLVYYCKAAGNLLKAFHYMLDAAAASIDVNNNIKTMALLKKIEEVIKQQENKQNKDFVITEEERARVECLKGQALCNMGCLEDGIAHFNNSLRLLNAPQPTSQLSLMTRTWKAFLVQTLHQKMPGVFTESKRGEVDCSIEQIRCLSYLSKAYTLKKDYGRAYLANLEQLNSVEEAPGNYWNELMTAYTDMLVSCLAFRKFNSGKIYEQVALETSKSASLNADDMVTIGKLSLTLVSFHLANGDINNALNSAMKCDKIAKNINDLSMKISLMPLLVQIYLLKLRTQSCYELLSEYRDVVNQCEDQSLKLIYYCCCLDHMLDAGDSVEDIADIVEFATLYENIENAFYVNYLKTGLALWYARQSRGSMLTQFSNYWPLPENKEVDIRYEIFLWRSVAARTECALHLFRFQGSNESKVALQRNLKSFRNTIKGKGLFEARLYHFQAYDSYLRKKTNRAKLLLEDCNVASKNNDVGFDFEWALASRRTWVIDRRDAGENEMQYNGLIKYILPAT